MNKARKEFYANFMDENSYDKKKLFKELKNLVPVRDLSFPDYGDKRVFVDDMGECFSRKVDNICNGVSVHSVEKGIKFRTQMNT